MDQIATVEIQQTEEFRHPIATHLVVIIMEYAEEIICLQFTQV